MSGRKLKVYGANSFLLGVQARTIAAVESQKEFATLIGTSVGYVRDYGCVTGNEEEIRIAFKHCKTAFVKCPTCGDWKNVVKERP